jgi:hypothetical protein
MFRQFPELRRDASRHCGRAAQGLMYANVVIVHEVDRHAVSVVLNLLRERVRQPCKPANAHPH